MKNELSNVHDELAGQVQNELTHRGQHPLTPQPLLGHHVQPSHLSWLESETAQWVRAMRWQRLVTTAAAQVGLRFNEWLVLVTTLELTRAKQDAVSQSDVCRALGLTRMQVSVAMSALAATGLVDRGPDMDGWMWRVFVTKRGEARLDEARARVAEAARYPPPRSAGDVGPARVPKRR